MAGRILLWALLGLLALLVLLILVPVTVYLGYDKRGGFGLAVRVLFVKLRILPQKEKPDTEKQRRKDAKKAEAKKRREEKKARKKAAKKKKAKPGEEEQAEEKKKRTLSQTLRLVKKLASSAGGALKFFLRFFHIRDVRLVLPVHDEDAGDTALSAGRMQALIGGARAALDNLLNIRYTRLVVLPDFLDAYGDALNFSCKIVVSPLIILISGVIFAKRFLMYDRNARKLYLQYREKQRAQKQQARAARPKQGLAQTQAGAGGAQNTAPKEP